MFELVTAVFSAVLFTTSLLIGVFLSKGYHKKINVVTIASLIITALSLVLVWQIDNLLHGELYSYGLQFDVAWANKAWFLRNAVTAALAGLLSANIASIILAVKPKRKKKRVPKKPLKLPAIPKIHSTPESPRKTMEMMYREEENDP